MLDAECKQLAQEDENLVKKIADLEKEIHDLKVQKKKLNTAAPCGKKERKLTNFKNILQFNSDNILSSEFVYKTLTLEIEEFCNHMKEETAKVAESRKQVIEQVSTLIAEEYSEYNVNICEELDICLWFVCE